MASKEGGIGNFLMQVRKEIEKTTWPSREQVKKALVAVAVVVIMYALLTGVFDFVIGLIMKYVFRV